MAKIKDDVAAWVIMILVVLVAIGLLVWPVMKFFAVLKYLFS